MLQSSCYYCLVILTVAFIIAPSQSVSAASPLFVAAKPHNSLLSHSSSKRRDANYYNVNHSNNDINGLLISTIGNIRGGDIDDSDGGGGTAKKKKKASKSSKKGAAAAAAAAHQQSSKSKAGKTSTTAATDNAEGEEDESSSSKAKTVINTAIKDPSHALGDAIRARAHILRKDKLPNYNYYYASSQERTFDSALISLGLSLGTAGLDVADDEVEVGEVEEENKEEENGNTKQKEVKSSMMAYYQYGHANNSQHQNQQFVQPSTSAVIANYFLKTHGGTHLLQCILSLLASSSGLLCIMLPSFPTNVIITNTAAAGGTTTRKMISSTTLARKISRSTTKYQLLQQTLFIAMTKLVSAIVGAVLLGARIIP